MCYQFTNQTASTNDDNYLGEFTSKAECVAKLVDDYDIIGNVPADVRPNIDIEALSRELFGATLIAIREGDAFHVYLRESGVTPH